MRGTPTRFIFRDSLLSRPLLFHWLFHGYYMRDASATQGESFWIFPSRKKSTLDPPRDLADDGLRRLLRRGAGVRAV